MTNCPICDNHERNDTSILLEAESWVVRSGPLASQVKGYTYVEPKTHVENWSELHPESMVEFGDLLQKIERFLQAEVDADRVYVVTISEAVRHLHFHLIPRKNGDDVKGLPLIEQATQQNAPNNDLTSSEYSDFLDKFKGYLAE